MKPDTGSRTERDAERYEARQAWLDAIRYGELIEQVDAWDEDYAEDDSLLFEFGKEVTDE